MLVARREQVYRALTRKLMTFALGRGLEPADDCTVDRLVSEMLAGGGRLSTLLERYRRESRRSSCRGGRGHDQPDGPAPPVAPDLRSVLRGLGGGGGPAAAGGAGGGRPAAPGASSPAADGLRGDSQRGATWTRWRPQGEGRDFELGNTFAPAARSSRKLQIFTGFAQRNADALGDGGGDHARANAAFLTGCSPAQDRGSGHPQRHLGRPGGRPGASGTSPGCHRWS